MYVKNYVELKRGVGWRCELVIYMGVPDAIWPSPQAFIGCNFGPVSQIHDETQTVELSSNPKTFVVFRV